MAYTDFPPQRLAAVKSTHDHRDAGSLAPRAAGAATCWGLLPPRVPGLGPCTKAALRQYSLGDLQSLHQQSLTAEIIGLRGGIASRSQLAAEIERRLWWERRLP